MSRVPPVPPVAPSRDLVNLEGLDDYAIDWPWRHDALAPGTTVVLRVKNEARSLPWVLPGLFRACQAVVLVDNESDDGTPDVARAMASSLGMEEKLLVHTYPFQVSRCGPEHLYTPADSVKSLTWFYNWSFSHVRTSYSMKWDGDMVLTEDGEKLLGDLAWQLPGQDVVLYVPRHSLYVASDSLAYLDLGLHNAEPFGYPMAEDYKHVKAFEWELRLYPDRARGVRLPEGSSIELKWLDSDEFAHWTDKDAFATSFRTARKRREFQLFTDLQSDRWEGHEGLHRIEAPAGQHVVEYVTQVWLPQAPRPLVRRS
jgi:glycosyltransferase involved in cell wall biosynthesis